MSDIDDDFADEMRKYRATRRTINARLANMLRRDEDKFPPCEFEEPIDETSESETNNENQ